MQLQGTVHRVMRAFGITVLMFALIGCHEAEPTMAGGKSVSHWLHALKDANAKVRKQAVFKLGNVGPADPAVRPALTAALRDADPTVRSEAILALLKLGPQAKEAIPALTELQERQN